MLRSIVAFVVVAGLAAGLYLVLAPLHVAFAVVVALGFAPVLAWQLSPLVMAALAGLAAAGKRSAHAPWQGKFYSYEGRQLRLYLDGGTVWIPQADLARILVPAPDGRELRLLGADYGAIPGHAIKGCTEAGIAQLLKARTGHRRATRDMIRFKAWLDSEALPNVKRFARSSPD